MSSRLYAILLSVLLLLTLCQMQSISAGPTDIIDIALEYFGPPWDINHDGETELLDASLLVHNYGETGTPGWIRSDIDDDGEIGILDASLLVTHYGEYWLVII